MHIFILQRPSGRTGEIRKKTRPPSRGKTSRAPNVGYHSGFRFFAIQTKYFASISPQTPVISTISPNFALIRLKKFGMGRAILISKHPIQLTFDTQPLLLRSSN
jgi:hypothetical protein